MQRQSPVHVDSGALGAGGGPLVRDGRHDERPVDRLARGPAEVHAPALRGLHEHLGAGAPTMRSAVFLDVASDNDLAP